MRVVLASINDLGKAAVEELVEQAELVAIFTVKERAKLYMNVSTFDEIAEKYNIPLIKITDINSKEVEEQMRAMNPDLCMCIGWNQIVRKNILDVPKYGWIGSHPTKLPTKEDVLDPKINQAGGNEPIPYTIRGGYEKSAMSFFWLAEAVDEGDIFAQQVFDVDVEHETTKTLLDKIYEAVKIIIREKFPTIVEGNPPRIPQELVNVPTYMVPLLPYENRIDLSKPIEETYRLIRSCISPYPNAFIEFGGQKIFIEHARLENGEFTELRVRVGGGYYEKM